MNVRDLDLNLLLVVDALLHERNATQAAKRLGVSQPTISFSLNKLRQVFGDDLFVKTPNGMEPTPRALSLREPIAVVLRTVQQEILIGAPFSPAETEREFKIAAGEIAEMVIMQTVWKKFRSEAPRARLTIVSSDLSRIETLLSEGGADLAVGYLPALEKANFFQQTLFSHPLNYVVSADYPTPKRGLSLDQFCAMEHAVVGNEAFAREVYAALSDKHHMKVNVTLRAPHISSVPHIVPGSRFLVVLPRVVAGLFAQDPRIKKFELPFEAPTFAIKQMWHKRLQHDPGASWLRRIVTSVYLRDDPTDDIIKQVEAATQGV
jgi:DNA-binding transcriptional LysR family regulator